MSITISGVAVLMMIFIHLFSYHDWLRSDVNWHSIFGIYGNYAVKAFCNFGGICVYMFAFMNGYSLIVSKRSYKSYSVRLKRLFYFLFTYWTIFVLFLLLGYAMNDEMPDIKNLLYNMVGINTGMNHSWVHIPFAWYVAFYIQFICIVPLLNRWSEKRNVTIDVSVLISSVIVVYFIRNLKNYVFIELIGPTVFPIISLCIGVIFAKWDIFQNLHHRFSTILSGYILPFAAFGIVIIYNMIINSHSNGGQMWSFFLMVLKTCITPLFMFVLIELFHIIYKTYITTALYHIGSVSLYLWFLHGIFFIGNKILQPYLYFFKYPLLIFMICMLSLMPIALVLKYTNNKMLTFFKIKHKKFRLIIP